MEIRRLVFILISAATVLIPNCFSEAEAGVPKFCGFPDIKPYDIRKQLCCNYKIYNRTSEDGKQLKCCNKKQVYDPDKKICCGDQLRDRTLLGGQTYSCCGGNQLYMEGIDGLCCNGTYYEYDDVPINRRRPEACCGRRQYDPGNNRCCNGKLHALRNNEECCGTEIYNMNSSRCDEYSQTIHTYTSKCNGQSYDTRYRVCCGEELYNFPFLRCCGKLNNITAYDPKTHKCEKHQAIPLLHRWCGSEHYDPESKLCCNETVHKITPGMSCCGHNIINKETTDCCNNKPFDKRNDQCCGGNIISSFEKCCGGYKLEIKQVCCNRIPINITDPDKRECCQYKLYDRFTQKCAGGRIIINTTSAQCGQKLFNQTRDRCCNSKLYRGARLRGLQCCLPGKQIFNPGNESCCNGVVKNGSSCKIKIARCGKEEYNSTTDRCCNSILYKNARTSGQKCCRPGKEIYDPGSQTCNNGEVKESKRHHKRRHADICRLICFEHRRLLKTLACKKYVYLIQKKKMKKTRKGLMLRKSRISFKARKDLFSRTKFKGRKWSFNLDFKDECECIKQKSKFLLGTDVFPPKSLEESHVIPFSKKSRKTLKVFKRRCQKS